MGMITASEADGMKTPPAEEATWQSLGTSLEELRLEWTLPTGQSFRWRRVGEATLEFVGVVGQRALRLRQLEDDVQYQVIARGSGVEASGDAAALHDYFNLGTRLADLAPGWRAACPRYARVHALLPGARMLRQDPVECLFSFICSQNNHIQRIHGMVERLCRRHGTPLAPTVAHACPTDAGELALHAFPTLEQLAAITEEELRGDGYGYRAKYIVGSAKALLGKPGGGVAWLARLRQAPFEEAVEELCTLPGIGPKVAACVCLFSLDKHQAIPVDTHVWALACKYYTPHLRNKSLTKKVHVEVQEAFVRRFGPYAGWAHNTLFIAELASTREQVPALGGGSKRAAVDPDDSGDSSSLGSDEEVLSSGSSAETTPRKITKRRSKLQPAAVVELVGDAPVTPAGEDTTGTLSSQQQSVSKRPRRKTAKAPAGG